MPVRFDVVVLPNLGRQNLQNVHHVHLLWLASHVVPLNNVVNANSHNLLNQFSNDTFYNLRAHLLTHFQ